VKLESLVIAGQHTAVNTFPSFVLTARQVKGAGSTRNPSPKFTRFYVTEWLESQSNISCMFLSLSDSKTQNITGKFRAGSKVNPVTGAKS
jgi:hypothetical protein